ncbi:MAG: LysM peptidoglycan-binding domain-containing protein [Sporichthyaceae bacterium]
MSTGTVIDRTGRLPHPAGRALRPAAPPQLRLVPAFVEPEREAPAPEGLLSMLPARAAEPVLRLTPRGRGIAVLVLLAAIFCLGMAFGSSANGADSVAGSGSHASVVVQPGQTMWGIARAAAPDRDPRVVVSEIRELNGIPTTEISAGQVLLLP